MSYNTQFGGLSPVQRIQYAAMTYLTRPTANSTAAIAIWLLGALATKSFLVEIGIGGTASSAMTSVLSLVFQAILTLLEGPVWHAQLRTHRVRFILGVGALVIDTVLNVGGCWFFLRNLGDTTFWQAIAAGTNTTTGPSAGTTLSLSALIAMGISAAPEALWDL